MQPTIAKTNNLSYLFVGQANLHRNPDCAASLANHIYYQMREMDIQPTGSFYERCQKLPPNPRREGLPKTVTEWFALREQRRKKRREERVRLNQQDTQSDSEDEELTAYDIAGPGNNSDSFDNRRRSQRLQTKHPNQGTNRPKLKANFRNKGSGGRRSVQASAPSKGCANANSTLTLGSLDPSSLGPPTAVQSEGQESGPSGKINLV